MQAASTAGRQRNGRRASASRTSERRFCVGGMTMAVAVSSRVETELDIMETLGLVPHFFSRIPYNLLKQDSALFKKLELGETPIPSKYKELIGCAMDSETSWRYC